MSIWVINKNSHAEIQQAFANFNTVLAIHEGEIVSLSSSSRVIKYHFNNQNFYIKHYFSRGKKILKYFCRKRWETEWNNLLFLKTLNIQVPKLIAYGEKKNWLSIKNQGIIITEEVPNALDLKSIACDHSYLFKISSWRKQVINIIASYVRTMHAVNFIHYDLQWRNILVTTSTDSPQVYLFDIPSGEKRKYFFKNGVIRDFYNLYKSAVKFLSRTDQLRFYLIYKKSSSLNPKDKAHIKKIIEYFLRKEREDAAKNPNTCTS